MSCYPGVSSLFVYWCRLLWSSPSKAFFRFVHRRGPVRERYSDRSTNFLLAERELREGVRRWNQSQIHESLRQKGVEWHFNAPLSPSSGGAWEILVKSAKKILHCLVSELWTMKLSTRYWSKLKIFWTIDRYPSQRPSTGLIGVDTGVASHRNAGFLPTCWCLYRSRCFSSLMAICAIACWLPLEKMGWGVSSSTPTSSEVVKTLQKSSRWRWRFYAWNKH